MDEGFVMDERITPLRDEMADVTRGIMPVEVTRWRVEQAADALLAPDGPLWPALRALGEMANRIYDVMLTDRRAALEDIGITGPLADACLAAAEATP